jgi:protein gp37
MSENTGISWCDHTFNGWWGCRKISPECENCYAERDAARWAPSLPWNGTTYRMFGESHWNEPRRWQRKAAKEGRRARVFCGSMCDVFEGNILLDDMRARLWALIADTPSLDWMLLTKRPENILRLLPFIEIGGESTERFRNAWIGTTVGCKSSLVRLDHLRSVPATVRFVSAEPLLEDLGRINLNGISLIIVGGESGPNARPCNVGWIRSIVRQCKHAGVACFVKQLGANSTENGQPTHAVCKRCEGRGYHHGFGEHGHDPDWCSECGGTGDSFFNLRDRAGADPPEWHENLRVRQMPEERR